MRHDVPLLLDLTGRHVVCVGAGPVARDKIGPLAAAGAHVTVIAPHGDVPGARDHERRPWRLGDLDRQPPVMLAVAATGVPVVDESVGAEADARGIWCLRTDGHGSVAMPSVVRRGGLLLAAATGAPALTRCVRQRLEDVFGEDWGALAALLADLRADPEVRAALGRLDPAERQARWRAVVAALTQPVRADAERARALLLRG